VSADLTRGVAGIKTLLI